MLEGMPTALLEAMACKTAVVITDFKSQFLKRRYLDDFDYVDFLNHMVEE